MKIKLSELKKTIKEAVLITEDSEDDNGVEEQCMYHMRRAPDITDAETVEILRRQGINAVVYRRP